jgi:hypothetical protein
MTLPINRHGYFTVNRKLTVKYSWRGVSDFFIVHCLYESCERLQALDKIFKNQPIRNESRLWWSCSLTDQDEMSKLYRGPSIDASYQVSVHLAKWFQRRIFKKNRPIRNKNCLWWPCLLMDRDEMSNRGVSDFFIVHCLYESCERLQALDSLWFLATLPNAMWAFAITCRLSSVNFSHFNLLLWNP